MPDTPTDIAPANVYEMVRQADKGDAAALAVVRRAMAEPGATARHGLDLAEMTQAALLRRFTGPGLRLAIERHLADLRAELAGPHPSPVERLLAERAVCGWLHLHYLEHVYATGVGKRPAQREAVNLEKAMTAAQRRFLAAVKTLAEVRRLVGPKVLVKIAERPVNVPTASSSLQVG